jgi:ribosome-associated protein
LGVTKLLYILLRNILLGRTENLLESKKLLDKVIEILEGKKAKDISIINIEGISILTDYFVICSGTSSTHIKSLADELEEKMEEKGFKIFHKEGYDTARWILMDFGEVIVHVFHEEERSFYKLERLWSDGLITYR